MVQLCWGAGEEWLEGTVVVDAAVLVVRKRVRGEEGCMLRSRF